MGVYTRRMENNIITYLKGIERGRVKWINLAQDRNKFWAVVNTAMNFRILQTAENLLSNWKKKFSFAVRTAFCGGW